MTIHAKRELSYDPSKNLGDSSFNLRAPSIPAVESPQAKAARIVQAAKEKRRKKKK